MSKQWADSKDGAFKRQVSSFRETISASHPVYKPAKGRYWLYVSLACPWAHRTLIARVLKGLAPVIGVSVVHWHLDDQGWRMLPRKEGETLGAKAYGAAGGIQITPSSAEVGSIGNDSARPFVDATFDPNVGAQRLSELYKKSNPDYNARYTVPVLWDTQTSTIVNNESADILRIFDSDAFDGLRDTSVPVVDLVPSALEKEIDEINTWVYDNINNGVYKAGFAESGVVYEREVENVFKHLEKVEAILKDKYSKLAAKLGDDRASIFKKYFLVGEQLTESDVRLYTTIARFDPVYVQHFKCNFTTIRNGFPYIQLWLQNLYWNYPAFKDTTDFTHIKLHYTRSHPRINPLGLTPLGPKPDMVPL